MNDAERGWRNEMKWHLRCTGRSEARERHCETQKCTHKYTKYIYIHTYVATYTCMSCCMYVCMYVCMLYVRTGVFTQVHKVRKSSYITRYALQKKLINIIFIIYTRLQRYNPELPPPESISRTREKSGSAVSTMSNLDK